MKFSSLLFALCVFFLSINGGLGQTSIPAGNVSGVWTISGSPYNIQGNIQIPNGATLTIEPGVVVEFYGMFKMNVQGRLLAIGTSADTILFTASNTSNGWRGIRFEQTASTNDSSMIVYCKLQYGKATGTSPNDRGGAIYFDSFSKAKVANCKIMNCYATISGGGIYCDVSAPIIDKNIIFNNTASFGGGIFCAGNPPLQPVLSNNIISNNTATVGGGLLISYLDPLVINNIISNNTASSSAGGVYCNGTHGSFINNTIVNNAAGDGGGTYCTYGATPMFDNTILWGNTASNGSQVFIDDNLSAPEFNYCNIQGGLPAFELNGNMFLGIYQNSLNTDPLFVLPSTNSGTGFNGLTADWSLQNTSPCINGGNPLGNYPVLDNIGNSRVTVCRIDIGAIEYQEGLPFSITLGQTQPILCFGDSTATVSVVASGGTQPYSYLWNNGETNSSITAIGEGSYTVTVTESGYGCSSTKSITIEQPLLPLSVILNSTNPICTNNNGSIVGIPSGGTAPYSFLWSTNSNNTDSLITGLTAGSYSVTISDNNGCSIVDSVLLITQYSLLSSSISAIHASCHNNDGSGSVTLNGGTAPYSYVWSTGSTVQSISAVGTGTYSVSISDSNGCTISDSMIITNSVLPDAPSICIVTVDSTSTKNLIVWEKPLNTPIDSFKIYREIASVYNYIGSVSYDNLSEYTDNTNGINPNTTAYKYKLSVIDSCGNESPLSSFHSPIHLQLGLAFPQGVNLSWSNYIGFTFYQYYILRDDIGDGNWTVIDSVSYGTTTYTSTDVLPNAVYTVEARKSMPCISTRQTSFTSTKSNIVSQTTGVKEITSDDIFATIYPNPSEEIFTIEVNQRCSATILNILGERIYSVQMNPNSPYQMNLLELPDGIYFVKIDNGQKIINKRIIKK
jgi:hypothetical protein